MKNSECWQNFRSLKKYVWNLQEPPEFVAVYMRHPLPRRFRVRVRVRVSVRVRVRVRIMVRVRVVRLGLGLG
jgi:hypothetical protein